MHGPVLAAVLLLAPEATKLDLVVVADAIERESKWYSVDPLLIIATIHVESRWNPRKRSATNDYGLAQIHVAPRGSARFLGREHELYDIRTNIREAARILNMWREYHTRWCSSVAHAWPEHYKWGKRVKRASDHVSRVLTLWDQLRAWDSAVWGPISSITSSATSPERLASVDSSSTTSSLAQVQQ